MFFKYFPSFIQFVQNIRIPQKEKVTSVNYQWNRVLTDMRYFLFYVKMFNSNHMTEYCNVTVLNFTRYNVSDFGIIFEANLKY